MKNSFAILSLLFILVLTLFSYKATFSFFSKQATSTSNVFAAASAFPTPTPTATPSPSPTPTPPPSINNIVINEVYYRIATAHRMGSEAESEWAELYNPTGSSISLANWSISDNTSCDNMPSASIPSHGFAIVSSHTETEFRAVWTTIPTNGSVVFIQAPSAIGNGLANNDELALRSGVCPSGPIVDHISWGSNTNGLNPSIPTVSAAGTSSERNPDGTDTNTNADFVNSTPPTPGT